MYTVVTCVLQYIYNTDILASTNWYMNTVMVSFDFLCLFTEFFLSFLKLCARAGTENKYSMVELLHESSEILNKG